MSVLECWIFDCAFPRDDDSDYCEGHDGKGPSPVRVYTYSWRKGPLGMANEKRAALYGRRCVIEATGTMGTALVRFLDNGERGTVSRRALRRTT